LYRFINRVAAHPDLQTDPSFVDFLEVEGDLPRATSTSALSSAGVMRLFSRVGDSIGKIAFRIDETDEVCSGCSVVVICLLHADDVK